MSMFGPEHQDLTHVQVFHNAGPPTEANVATYGYFPIRVALPFDSNSAVNAQALPGVQVGLGLWVHRAMRLGNGKGTKPNPIRPAILHSSGVECRLEYSTIGRAIAATRIAVLYSAGGSVADCQAIAVAAGMAAGDVLTHVEAAAQRETLFIAAPDPDATPPYTEIAYMVARDKIVLPAARLVDAVSPVWGIALDYEAQDQRSEAETLALIQWCAGQTSTLGWRLFVYTNPLDTATSAANGLGPGNLPAVAQAADFTSILIGAPHSVGGVYEAFRRQLAAFGPDVDHARLALTVAPSGERHEALQAGYVFRRLLTDWSRIRACWVWPNLMPMGGDDDSQANRMIGAAFFGQGAPAPMLRRG